MFSDRTIKAAQSTWEKVRKSKNLPVNVCSNMTVLGIINYQENLRIIDTDSQDKSIFKSKYISDCKEYLEQFKTGFEIYNITDDGSAIGFCKKVQRECNKWNKIANNIEKAYLKQIELAQEEFEDKYYLK